MKIIGKAFTILFLVLLLFACSGSQQEETTPENEGAEPSDTNELLDGLLGTEDAPEGTSDELEDPDDLSAPSDTD